METIEILLSIVGLVFGILQVILFFRIWGMTNNIAEMNARFKAICPTEEEKEINAKIEKLNSTNETNTEAIKNTKGLNVGDNVVYEPMNRKMIIKEITKEGLLVCISYKPNGKEEYEGTYKPEQVKRF